MHEYLDSQHNMPCRIAAHMVREQEAVDSLTGLVLDANAKQGPSPGSTKTYQMAPAKQQQQQQQQQRQQPPSRSEDGLKISKSQAKRLRKKAREGKATAA